MLRHRASAVALAAVFAGTIGCGSRAPATASAPARGAARAQTPSPAGPRFERAPDELLVRFRPFTTAQQHSAAARRVGARVVHEFHSVAGLTKVKLSGTTSAEAGLHAFRASPEVQYAEPNYVVRKHAAPNDPFFPEQWALHNIGQSGGVAGADIDAELAWDLTTGGKDVVVAVIDSGIDVTHPDLRPNLFRNEADCNGDGVDDDGNGFADDCNGVDIIARTGDLVDEDGHGTHVAGIIGAAGNDGLGVTGVAWNTILLGCRFLDAEGNGYASDAIACLDYVAQLKDRGVHIVATNDSWGGGFYSQAMVDAIDAQRARGILFVTSAGDEGASDDDLLDYPCSYSAPNILCVGASDPYDHLAAFSNDGTHTVHLVAPGRDILSTLPVALGSYGYGTGTSIAAPHVTGAVALLAARWPAADWRTLKNRILAGGDDQPNGTVTGRRLNVSQALTCTGRTVGRSLRPVGPRTNSTVTLAVGAPLELAYLHVSCEGPAGEVQATITPGGEVVTLRDDGHAPDAAAGDGVYGAAWLPPASGTYRIDLPGGEAVDVIADADLQPGFPVRTWFGSGSYHAGPALSTLVGDIDGEAGLEILVPGMAGYGLWAFRADGRVMPGWPIYSPGTPYASLGKLSGAPGQQVVVGTFSSNELFAVDGTGTLLPGWPAPHDLPWLFWQPPLLSDVDGDGLDEVFGTTGAYRADGAWLNAQGAPRVDEGMAALADLFGDGELELVSLAPSEVAPLKVRRLDGSSLAGFPRAVGNSLGVNNFPVVGDVDGDGAPEIVLAADAVEIFGRDGTLERHIPLSGHRPYGTAPALADLDGDGRPEIIVQTDTALDVLRADGTSLPGWPVQWSEFTWANDSAPVVGDVDGDGAPEIVVTTGGSDNYVRVYHADGTSSAHFPKRLYWLGSSGTPAIADIDQDGRNEIIITGNAWLGYEGYFDRVWVYDLGGPPHGPVLWGQLMGNARHTGTAVPTVAAPRSFHALRVTTRGLGTVASSPFGIACGTSCSRTFAAGTTIQLTATPGPRQDVIVWSGACTGTARTCTILLQDDTDVAVTFGPLEWTLAVSRTGTGTGTVTSSPAGVNCWDTCTASFSDGSDVTLSATAGSFSTFAGWFGADCGGTEPTCVVAMTQARSVVARFSAVTFLLTVTRTGGGGGRVTSRPYGIFCGGDCAEPFAGGTSVTLTATADGGSMLEAWSGPCTVTTSGCVVEMSEARAVEARFARRFFPLTVTRTGDGSGAVSSTPAGISCGATCTATFARASTVVLTATPASGSTFVGWSGACTGEARTCTVILDQDTTATARFDAAGGGGSSSGGSSGGGGGGSSGGGGGGNGGGGGCGTSGSLGWLSWASLALLRRRSGRSAR